MTCSIESAIISEAAPAKYARNTGWRRAGNEVGGAALMATRNVHERLFALRLGLLQFRALRPDASERLERARDRLVADLHEERNVAGVRAAARARHGRLRGDRIAPRALRVEIGTVARRTLGHDVVQLDLHEAPASNSPADCARPIGLTRLARHSAGRCPAD